MADDDWARAVDLQEGISNVAIAPADINYSNPTLPISVNAAGDARSSGHDQNGQNDHNNTQQTSNSNQVHESGTLEVVLTHRNVSRILRFHILGLN